MATRFKKPLDPVDGNDNDHIEIKVMDVEFHNTLNQPTETAVKIQESKLQMTTESKMTRLRQQNCILKVLEGSTLALFTILVITLTIILANQTCNQDGITEQVYTARLKHQQTINMINMVHSFLNEPPLQLRCKSAIAKNDSLPSGPADCIYFRRTANSPWAGKCYLKKYINPHYNEDYSYFPFDQLFNLCRPQPFCPFTGTSANDSVNPCKHQLMRCGFSVSSGDLTVKVVNVSAEETRFKIDQKNEEKLAGIKQPKVFFTISLKNDSSQCFTCPQSTSGFVFLKSCSEAEGDESAATAATDEQLFYLNGTGLDFSVLKL